MRWLKPAFLATLFIFAFVPSVSGDVTVPTNDSFGFPTYNTLLNFSSQLTFDSVYRENEHWYFNGYGFQVQNANMTVTDFFESNTDEIKFTLYASNGTSATYFFCNNKGEPQQVSGADSWSYDANGTLTLSVIHQSSRSVTVSWIGGTGGGLYELSVHVNRERFSIIGAIVTVDNQSKTTDPLGRTTFHVGYGFHIVTVSFGIYKETREIFVDRDLNIGFDFENKIDRRILFFALVPVGLGIVAYAYLKKRR